MGRVTDGAYTAYGEGPSLRLPAAVASRVRDGDELGLVLDDRLCREAVAEREGAVGVYTDGRLTRSDALADAVVGAFGPFLTDRYDTR